MMMRMSAPLLRYRCYQFLVLIFSVDLATSNPIAPTTPSNVATTDYFYDGNHDADALADLWLQLCGWKEKDPRNVDELVTDVRRSVGAVDGFVESVSCEEPPPRSKQASLANKNDQLIAEESTSHPPKEPEVQKQVIFIEIPESNSLLEMLRKPPPPPPRVVIYVLPPEENHIFNFIDMRGRDKLSRPPEPTVHFLSNSIDYSSSSRNLDDENDAQRVPRGVVRSLQTNYPQQVSGESESPTRSDEPAFEMFPATYMGYSYFVE